MPSRPAVSGVIRNEARSVVSQRREVFSFQQPPASASSGGNEVRNLYLARLLRILPPRIAVRLDEQTDRLCQAVADGTMTEAEAQERGAVYALDAYMERETGRRMEGGAR